MDNRGIFSEIIKRQMALLGPSITLARVSNVPGIEVDRNGQVVSVTGDTKILLSDLINQFVDLSGLIVKKTMESILASHPNGAAIIGEVKQEKLSPTQTNTPNTVSINQQGA